MRLVGAENQPQHLPLYHKGFQCHTAKPPELLLPAVLWYFKHPQRSRQGHRRTQLTD